jgi:hypothetical protein
MSDFRKNKPHREWDRRGLLGLVATESGELM